VVIVSGSLTLSNATINLGKNDGSTHGQLQFNDTGPQTVDGLNSDHPGTIVFGSSGSSNGIFGSTNTGGFLTLGKNLTVQGAAGEIEGSSIQSAVTADPTVCGKTTGTISLVNNAGPWTNDGTLTAQNGGEMDVWGPPTNFSGGTLTGGTWQAINGGTLRLIGASVTTDAASILIDGAGSHIYSTLSTPNTNALANLATIAAGASLIIQNGSNLTTAGALANSGTLTIGPSSTLTVSGNYTQAAGAALGIDIGGVASSGMFGTLRIAQTPTLAGELDIGLVNGFVPTVADSYAIMSFAAGSRSTDFANENGLAFAGGQFAPGYGNSNLTLVVQLNQAPAITSANSAAFTVGTQGMFPVTATGVPTPAITESGALPSGVSFVDNHDGTATLSGTPTAGTAATYSFTITAGNGVGNNATQSFTLSVNQAPAITSANSTTFAVGTAGTFTVTATGSPTATISESGALPNGVSFSSATGVLSGTPAADTAGSYPLVFTAHNGVGSDATQNFTLTVQPPPRILVFTTAAQTLIVEQPSDLITVLLEDGSGNVVQAGASGVVVTLSSTSSKGTFLNAAGQQLAMRGVTIGPGSSTASFEYTDSATGTPVLTAAATGYSASQQETVVLTDIAPTITSAKSATFIAGSSSTFTMTSTGVPTPTFSESGTLPSGVSFTANLDGTATLSGTPAATSGGIYSFSITARNGIGDDATQTFTLTVDQPAVITSASSTAFAVGLPGAFTIHSTGFPMPTLSIPPGSLPAGVTFTANTDGTATLTGTPAAGTGGMYAFTVTASNGTGSSATQSFTLSVNVATHFAISAPATVTSGTPFHITVVPLDYQDNPVSSYIGTVHFTSSDGQAILQADQQINGRWGFSVTLTTVGSQSLTVADTTYRSITGTTGLTIAVQPVVVTWINPAGGDWDTASNWSTGQVPGPANAAVIAMPSITVQHASAVADTVYSLTSNAANLTISGGSLTLAAGALSGSGNVSVSTGGTLIKTGSATLTISTPFVNAGAVVVHGGLLSVARGGTGTGTFAVDSTGTLNLAGTAASPFTLASGSSVSGAGVVSYNAGTINLGGTYNVTGGTMIAGGIANFISPVTSVGALIVAHGTANFRTGATVTVPALTLEEGTLTGSDIVAISGSVTWLSGTIGGTGSIVLQTSAQTSIIQGTLDTRTLTNLGTVSAAAGSVLTLAHGASVFNAGTWTDQGGNTVSGALRLPYNFRASAGTFNNTGKYLSSGGGTTSYTVPFNNQGTLEVQSGTLSLGGGGSGALSTAAASAVFQVDSGALLAFPAGAYTLNAGTQFTGAGFADVSGATATIAATVYAAKFELDSGAIAGPGDLDISDTFTWTGGKLLGTGMIRLGTQALGYDTHTVTGPVTVVQRPVVPAQDIVVTRPGGAGSGTIQLASYRENETAWLLPSSLYLCSFTDGSRPYPASRYVAIIYWGDHASSLGTITPNAGRGFNVSSPAHRYADEGTYSIRVEVDGPFGETASTSFVEQVTVSDTPLGGVARSGSESFIDYTRGIPATLATFWDPGSDSTIGDYSATVSWNGGTPAPATISRAANGLFNVTVPTAGRSSVLPYSVTVTDRGGARASFQGQLFPIQSSVNPVQASATDIAVPEGSSASFAVATFTSLTAGNPTSYSATVYWPNTGAYTPATIQTGPRSGFLQVVTQPNLKTTGYAPFQVVIKNAAGVASVANGIATATEVPINVTANNFTAAAGNAVLVPASFSDPANATFQTNYSMTIVWGDGATSGPYGSFNSNNWSAGSLNGEHVYANPGTYKVRVIVLASDGGTAEADVTATVMPTTVTATGQTITSYWDIPSSSVVATFSDRQLGTSPASYTATIDWQAAPGTMGTDTTPGTIVANGDGTFSVIGSHAYHTYGSFPVYVTISKATGGLLATAVGTANVGVGLHPINVFEGSAYNQPLAAFPNLIPAGGDPTQYIVSVNWGDGPVVYGGTVDGTQDSLGAWMVSAPAHAYAEAGTYTITITVADSLNRVVQTATDTATVVDAPLTVHNTVTIAPWAGYATTLVVTSVTDQNATTTKTLDFSATINWGDGQSSLGSFVPVPGKPVYNLIGTHTYATHGNYTISGVIYDVDGASVPFSENMPVAQPPLQTQGSVVVANASGTVSGTIASFFVPGDMSANAAEFAGSTINWGDGATSSGAGNVTVALAAGMPAGHFTISAAHTYNAIGVYPITINIINSTPGGKSGTAGGQGIDSPAPNVPVGTLGSALLGWLRTMQTDLNTSVFNNPVPLVGGQLASASVGQVMSALQTAVTNAYANIDHSTSVGLQTALFEAFGPYGLNVLQPASGTGTPSITDVVTNQVTVSGVNFIDYEVHLQLNPGNNQSHLPFQLALPGVPLQLNDPGAGSVTAAVGYTLDLKFSVRTGTTPVPFFGNTSLNVNVVAKAPGMNVSGTDHLLAEQAQDDPSNPSSLNGTYSVTFAQDGNDTNIGIGQALLNAASAINLKLNASFSPGAGGPLVVFNPHLLGELNATWNFTNANPSVYPFGNAPVVAINNVQIDLNSFYNKLVAPLVAQVQVVTKPLEPLAEFLLKPIPGLTDVTQLMGLGPTTVAGLVAVPGVTALAHAIEIINNLPIPAAGGTINLGGFTMKDPRAANSQGNPAWTGVMNFPPIAPPTPVGQQEQSGPQTSVSFFANISKINLDFPILDDPTQAFKLLLGQDATLFTFSLPKLGFGRMFQWQIPIPLPPPLPTGIVQFQVQVQVGLTVGGTSGTAPLMFNFDTSGLRAGNPLAGFTVQNAQIAFTLQVTPGLSIGIPNIVSLALEIDVNEAFALTLVDTANHNSTTIPATDFGKIRFQPSFSLGADVALEVDIFNNNCLFKLIIGSVTWDVTTGKITPGGVTTGC
jgi:hypothetical protein